MKYGYARVSTDDQTPALQIAALKKAGCKTIFTDDGISGATAKRPALQRCLKTLRDGDTLTVWKLDRLGRSVRDLINIAHDLKERDIELESLTEAINSKTVAGRAMMQVLAIMAEMERGFIIERTGAGLRAARKHGVKFGRKPKLTDEQLTHARDLLDKHRPAQEVAALLRVNRSTRYRALAC